MLHFGEGVTSVPRDVGSPGNKSHNQYTEMPKGKGKKKGKSKGDDKKEPPPPVIPAEQPTNSLTKDFYIIQVRDLEDRLSKYQIKCDKLQLSNEELQKQLKQQLEDQEQMTTFLKKKSQQQTEHQLELEEELSTLKQAKEAEKEHYEQQITQLKDESQRALDQMAVESKVLQGQLKSLETFRLHKDSMEAEMKQLRETIEKQQALHNDSLYGVEKKAVLDKDRMKKEMVTKVNLVAAEFRKVSDLQMAETTKRTIRENVAINQQLTKMSDKTLELIGENETLKKREKDLVREVELLESNEKELTKKSVSNQKVMGLLKDRIMELESQLELARQHVLSCGDMEREKLEALSNCDTFKRETEQCKDHNALLKHELDEVKAQNFALNKELYKLRNMLANTSRAIQASLQSGGSSDGSTQREDLLTALLTLMTSAPDKDSMLSPKLQYTPGDLGLVPPPVKQGSSRSGHHQLPPLPSINPSLTRSQPV